MRLSNFKWECKETKAMVDYVVLKSQTEYKVLLVFNLDYKKGI